MVRYDLRDRQKDYYYKNLDDKFPGIRERYEKIYGSRYKCFVKNINSLDYILRDNCVKYEINLKMPTYQEEISDLQLSVLRNVSSKEKTCHKYHENNKKCPQGTLLLFLIS